MYTDEGHSVAGQALNPSTQLVMILSIKSIECVSLAFIYERQNGIGLSPPRDLFGNTRYDLNRIIELSI